MNFLIVTHYCDVHAILVEYTLERMGHRVFRWITEAQAGQQVHNAKYTGNTSEYNLKYQAKSINLDEIDVVWWRRMNDVSFPDIIDPRDIVIASNEWRSVFGSIAMMIPLSARWVNPWAGKLKGDMKLLQLRIAQQVGMRIPNTLVSNDAHEIRNFVASQRHGAVHKMFGPASWQDSERVVRSRTRRVEKEHLTNEGILALCPGVFQERIPKSKELRATFMGDKCICISIDPKDSPEGVCDWRSIPRLDYNVRIFDLPDPVKNQCLELMRKIGIVFGCFDILLSDEGDYVFLEVNENGQFLWIEHADPSIKMLQEFCSFLTGEFCPPITPLEIFSDRSFVKMLEQEEAGAIKRVDHAVSLL